MNDTTSAPTSPERGKITSWPSIVMLLLLFGIWFFIFSDIVFLFLVGVIIFLAICLLYFVVLVAFRELKSSVSFLIPVVLIAVSASILLLITPVTRSALRQAMFHSRNHVDFLIYAIMHHIKADVRQNGYKYKRWHLRTDLWQTWYIVFDVTDEIVKKDNTLYDNPMASPDCRIRVFSVHDHFYLVEEGCPPL